MSKNVSFLFNIFTALVIFPFLKRWLKKNIILIGGHEGKIYGDNSKALYEHLKENYNSEYEVYWVINKDSSVKEQIETKIIRGSVKNYLYFLASLGLFYTHSASDVAPIIHRYFKPKGTRVHLAHGVAGLKKTKYMGKSKQGIEGMADLFVSVSDFEKNIKVKEFGIKASSIIVTGFPRFDNLYNSLIYNQKQENIIIFMPTWREWYKDLSKEEFIKTDFFQSIMNLLKNDEIIEILKNNNYQLHLYLHFYFHQFISTLDINNDCVKIVNINEDVQQLLLKSQILITDYSSVCWDFFYLNKPTLFFQFDQERYEEERGSYLDLNRELIGLKSNSLDQLIKDLNYTIQNQEKVVNEYNDLKSKYFKYHDNHNCKRVIEQFEQHLKNMN
jgi:CDP-glycerol glycerophosphotransferase (TagB/SpsB family)